MSGSPVLASVPRLPAPVFAVVVLYGLTPAESPALQSLEAARTSDPALLKQLSLLIWDNTPGPRQQPAAYPQQPAEYQARYLHDPTNPGLCTAYNAALARAHDAGATWLMLLDQDTTLTASYLREALALTGTTTAAALLPRLTHNGITVSPFHPTAQGPVRPIAHALQGIATEPLQAFNSGSIFRVATIDALGGFDTAFPLDYLDHATFAALQDAGGTLYVMASELHHDLSTHTNTALDDKALQRQAAILAAEHRFLARYGTAEQRRLAPVRTLRHALSVLVHKRDLRHAFLILKTALSGAQ